MVLDTLGGGRAGPIQSDLPSSPLVCSPSASARRLQGQRVKSAAACRLIKIIQVSFIGIATGGWQGRLSGLFGTIHLS